MAPDQLTGADPDDDPGWAQTDVEFTDWTTAAHTTAEHLRPVLDTAPGGWWYIRKHPHWRIRHAVLHPGRGVAEQSLGDILDALMHQGLVRIWHPAIYEPEMLAFGGPAAMGVAHDLFTFDSRAALDLLTTDVRRHVGDHVGRIELSLLAVSRTVRAAGLDRYEQADVWAKVADSRRSTTPCAAGPGNRVAVNRLLTLDTRSDSTLVARGPLRPHSALLAAFDDTGTRLARLHRTGRLTRGLRAVLAHHVIFHWNRHAVPGRNQYTLAALARDDLLSGGS